jgi:hypothetical protein
MRGGSDDNTVNIHAMTLMLIHHTSIYVQGVYAAVVYPMVGDASAWHDMPGFGPTSELHVTCLLFHTRHGLFTKCLAYKTSA